MNIKIPHSWLLEYLETKATPQDIQKYLSLCGPSVERVEKVDDDHVYDIEITSNRIDTVSVYGIAREAAAILSRFGLKSRLLPFASQPLAKAQKIFPFKMTDKKKLFRRMLAIVLDDIDIGPSPAFIRERLQKAGVRSLNNLIDITNYVMLEVGYPTHVFDYDRIKTATLMIRHAKAGEIATTLDYKNCPLIASDVVVDDGTGRIIDLPGIMGTANSVVTADSKRVVLFNESNDPKVVRQTSMRLGLRSLAATINEKEPDAELARVAILRASELFEKYANAKVASQLHDLYPVAQKAKPIKVNLDFINHRLGVKLTERQIIEILSQLEFSAKKDKNILVLTPPSFRSFDVTIPEDIVEEVARIYGYHNLPKKISPLVYIDQPEEIAKLNTLQLKIKYFLKHLGLHEVMNYSLISKKMIENSELKIDDHLVLTNTISEEIKYMRTHLLPSLIMNIKENEGKSELLRFFEIAKTYKKRADGLPLEAYKLGIVVNTSYLDLKGIIDALLSELNIKDFLINKVDFAYMEKNMQAEIIKEEDRLVRYGQIAKKHEANYQIKRDFFAAVFDLASLIKHSKPIATYQPINSYAVVKLDLTFKLGRKKNYAQIINEAHKLAKLLRKTEYLGKYEDKISVRFYFASYERNITEDVAKSELEKIKALV